MPGLRIGRLKIAAAVAAIAAAACEPTGSTPGPAPEPVPVPLSRSTPDSPGMTAAGIMTGTVDEYLSDPRYATADLERGRILSLACQACHTLGAGEDHNLGPNLHGMFGRPAAQLEGFEYSEELRASGVVWTPAVLETWLAEPNDFVPGNNMVFAGYRSESESRRLVAHGDERPRTLIPSIC